MTEGCIDKDTLECLYDFRIHEDVDGGRIECESDEDDLDELTHLTFKEIEGEQSDEYGLVTNDLWLLPLKLWKHNIGTDEK